MRWVPPQDLHNVAIHDAPNSVLTGKFVNVILSNFPKTGLRYLGDRADGDGVTTPGNNVTPVLSFKPMELLHYLFVFLWLAQIRPGPLSAAVGGAETPRQRSTVKHWFQCPWLFLRVGLFRDSGPLFAFLLLDQ